ncbi:MAG: DUF4124 domain-containing protein [Burkholderiales bacterium]|nr:DUF4124 domain-containing protein [Burkholderiales bacterium]
MNRLSVAIWLVLCVALPASAQMYKWVDSNGKVHYSDKAPPGNVKSETLREAARPPGPPATGVAKEDANKDAAKAGPKTTAEQDQAFRKRQAEEAKAREKQDEAEKIARDRAENCKRARAAAANLELGGRQLRVDEKGERVYLTDAQIAEETAKAKQEAAAACK